MDQIALQALLKVYKINPLGTKEVSPPKLLRTGCRQDMHLRTGPPRHPEATGEGRNRLDHGACPDVIHTARRTGRLGGARRDAGSERRRSSFFDLNWEPNW